MKSIRRMLWRQKKGTFFTLATNYISDHHLRREDTCCPDAVKIYFPYVELNGLLQTKHLMGSSTLPPHLLEQPKQVIELYSALLTLFANRNLDERLESRFWRPAFWMESFSFLRKSRGRMRRPP